MNVKGYIYGKETHGPVSPRKGDKSNTRLSRQAVAGKARVGVPPTRLNGQHTSRPNNSQPTDKQQNGTDISPQEPSHEEQNQNGINSPEKHGDMFDTDVEGIDDSTIASGSVIFGDENLPYQSQAPVYQGGINRGISSQSSGTHNLTDLRGWADRLASELPSDSEESGAGDEQETQQLMRPPVQDEESSDAEPAQDYDMRPHHGDTASFRIEAALREVGRRPGIRQPYPMPSGVNRGSLPPFNANIPPPPRQDLGETQPNYDNHTESQQRSQSPATIPIRGRFNRAHRLMEPYPSQHEGDDDASNAKVSRPQTDQHVTLNSEDPLSPAPNQQANLPSPEKTVKRNPISKSNEAGGYTGSKAFDLTDLSALDDSSDSNDKQDMLSPSQRTKHSPKKPKRPFDTYGVDYPSEVLLAKPFSDLKSESFDFNPSPPQPATLPTEKSSLSLAEKLPLLKTLTVDQRCNFFSSLTINEWEESGDWLVEQFGTILQNVKNARRERRKVAAAFEKEVERRYEDVEGKSKDLDEKLVDMKTGGLEVLKGRSPG